MLDMRVKGSVAITLLFVLQCLSIFGSSLAFDFYYFIQQWPGSYCSSDHNWGSGCCYPPTGKPDENFTIQGLWPAYNTGKWPRNCNTSNNLDLTQISDLFSSLQKNWPSLSCPSDYGTTFWEYEWGRHGTCSNLDQHSYFQATLDLKKESKLLQALNNAGIYPGNSYELESIKEAIEGGVGYEPYIKCNNDTAGNTQLFEVYLCVDKSVTNFIKCPAFPTRRSCVSNIAFPSLPSDDQSEFESLLVMPS